MANDLTPEERQAAEQVGRITAAGIAIATDAVLQAAEKISVFGAGVRLVFLETVVANLQKDIDKLKGMIGAAHGTRSQ